jgi:predicted Zn-dependent protease
VDTSNQDAEHAGPRRRRPPDASLLERLAETGFLATEFGLHPQAERIFSCLARLRPGKPSPHIALAMVQARRGRMQPAIASLREVIDRHPDSELARAVLGTMLAHIGDPEGCELLQGVIARGADIDAVNVAASCIDQAQAQAAKPAAAMGAVEYFRHYNVRA